MRIELRRDALLVITESDQDRAFIEDTLGIKNGGDSIPLIRINNVTSGFQQSDTYVLKAGPKTNT